MVGATKESSLTLERRARVYNPRALKISREAREAREDRHRSLPPPDSVRWLGSD